jgi:hypothetical protein
METVEHLIETGLGQSQEGNVLRKSGAPSLPAGGARVDCSRVGAWAGAGAGAALVIGDHSRVTMASVAVTQSAQSH